MPSSRFEQLHIRIQELKGRFLPPSDPAFNYSQSQVDSMVAFRLLVHAEFEAFLEQRVIEAMDIALDRWTRTHVVNPTVLSLLAFTTKKWPEIPDCPAKDLDIGKRINKARSIHFLRLRDFNNGIREKDLLAMLLPVGLERGLIDNAWLGAMEAFGLERGAVAHNSAVRQGLDPVNEASTVDALLNGIAAIDDQLIQISTCRVARWPRQLPLRYRLAAALRLILNRR